MGRAASSPDLTQLALFDLGLYGKNAHDPQAHFRLAKAGEHLAAFELMIRGINVTVAAEGLPYDLLAEIDGTIAKVQVKTASSPKDRGNYCFDLKCGSHKAAKRSVAYGPESVDLFAIVALDIRKVAFIHADEATELKSLRLRPLDFLLEDVTSATLERCRQRMHWRTN